MVALASIVVSSIDRVWMAATGLFVPVFIYDIGTTVLNGGISMIIIFFVNKIIFPRGGVNKIRSSDIKSNAGEGSSFPRSSLSKKGMSGSLPDMP